MPHPKRSKIDREKTVRMTVEVPMLMRQAIRDRERLSCASGADVIRGILLAALRTEMEMITRDRVKAGQLKAV